MIYRKEMSRRVPGKKSQPANTYIGIITPELKGKNITYPIDIFIFSCYNYYVDSSVLIGGQMANRKRLQELTIKDNFMFGAVMMVEDNCRKFLELSLGFPIAHLEISKEKSIVYHPEQKGVRLDIYAKDEQNTRYNVEMQVIPKKNLAKRSRYYHSQIDMELLPSGIAYESLPDTYVIFICDFDPFGKGKYCYTFINQCIEDDMLTLKDGCCTLFLSTCGKNESEVSKDLVEFLRYAGSSPEKSNGNYTDPFVNQIQKTIEKVKCSREMEERYMLLEELLAEERLSGMEKGLAEGREKGLAEGHAKGLAEGREKGLAEERVRCILELLETYGQIPEKLRKKIENETNSLVLQEYFQKAARAGSMEAFLKEMYRTEFVYK